MAIIGIVVGMMGAMVGVVLGLVGGLIGLVLGLFGGFLGLLPHTIPLVLIVLGVAMLLRGSSRQIVPPGAGHSPASSLHNPSASQ